MTAPPPEPTTGSTKGEQTRQLIVDTALRLFREHGYEQTTMRAIAAAAGVSVGNAYYYFPSKQHLVQAYYQHSQDLHEQAARPVLDGPTDLGERLAGVLRARVDTMQTEKAFATAFFRYAADPASPLSPFSEESTRAREMSTALYAEALRGSTAKVPVELRDELPHLLWLYQMGVVLFWIHDSSPGAAKTYLLVDRTVPIVVRLLGLARYRLLRPLVGDALALLADLRSVPAR